MATWDSKQVHGSPTMRGTGSVSTSRNGSTITVSGTVTLSRNSYQNFFGSGNGMDFAILFNGSLVNHYTLKNQSWENADWGLSSTISINCSFDNNNAGTVTFRYVCYSNPAYADFTVDGSCDYGWEHTDVGSDSVSAYNPETPASKATDGAVYTTNNASAARQATLSEKPDQQIWFDWWRTI